MTRRVELTAPVARVFRELVDTSATNAQIAGRLYLSIDGVKSHVRKILRATGCPNRTAVVSAYHRGEIEVFVKPPKKGLGNACGERLESITRRGANVSVNTPNGGKMDAPEVVRPRALHHSNPRSGVAPR